ncbi:MAG: serine hydrolase [Burkholderiales bacterium]|nr:serine hydrolase [Burkholderiales bacterium]
METNFFKRVAWVLLAGLLTLGVLVFGVLAYYGIPANAAGMAAKGVCSAAFVAGRPAQDLFAQDVLPANPILASIRIDAVDQSEHSVTASFLGLVSRRAVLVRDRGCVLDLPVDTTAQAYKPATNAAQPWPQGDATLPVADWGAGVDAQKLQHVVDAAFEGAGNPLAANARGLAVVHQGRLLVMREAPGFAPGTGLHGWSMTKTVTGMLTYKLSTEAGLPLDALVVDAFPAGREPDWVDAWRRDARKNIRVSDLLTMRDGLAMNEGYGPLDAVPQMLWGAPDIPAWAARHPAEAAPAARWNYLSASTNLLAGVARARFATDADYWAYPRKALFDPLGARSAVLETDSAGNWVGSSYLWASVGDWARLGQLMLQDGKWGNTEVLPAGWLKFASTPSMKQGEGQGYGAQSWLFGNPAAGRCRAYPGVPADTIAMGGHWGQMVAMVPSRNAVVVRLGWTFRRKQFDECQLLSEVLAALPH